MIDIVTLLWLIVALTSFNVLGGLAVMYWCWRCGARAEHAVQDIKASSQHTAMKATHIEANIRYLIEVLQKHYGHADELRRQQLLSETKRQLHAMGDTMPLPIVQPGNGWLGDPRRAMKNTEALVVKRRETA